MHLVDFEICFSVKLQVSKDRGEELAIEYGIKFMETSAKASINVEEAFFTLARDIKCKMEKRLVSFFEQYQKVRFLNKQSFIETCIDLLKRNVM